LHAQAGGQALNRVGKRNGPHPAPIHKHSRVGGHGRHRKPGLRRHRPVPVLSSQPLRAAESFTEPSSLLQTEPPQLAIRRNLVQRQPSFYGLNTRSQNSQITARHFERSRDTSEATDAVNLPEVGCRYLWRLLDFAPSEARK
jgi:hypothetical protein